jgi:type II secretory pathway component GspD/PulD (secretin)
VEGGAARRTSTFAGELRILDGQSGRIATGTEAPVTSRRIRRTRHGAMIEESTQLANAESGFEATPRVLRDGRVELALRGFESSLRTRSSFTGSDAARPDGVIDRASAETRIVLAPGATVALGGITRAESAQHGSFAGGGASDAAQERLLLVTVNVE